MSVMSTWLVLLGHVWGPELQGQAQEAILALQSSADAQNELHALADIVSRGPQFEKQQAVQAIGEAAAVDPTLSR